jgi:hypothetical protein
MKLYHIAIVAFVAILLALLYFILGNNTILMEGLKEQGVVFTTENTTYDISNVEHQYHPSYIDTNVDASGGFALPVFNTPHTYRDGNKTFVPSYVDSIYMSQLTGLSQVAYYADISGGNENNTHPSA